MKNNLTNIVDESNVRGVQIMGWRKPDGKVLLDQEYDDWPQTIVIGNHFYQLEDVGNDFEETDDDENVYELADYVRIGEARIVAEVHDDVYRTSATFDAIKWFEQASKEEILALQKEGWAFDQTSDNIARFMADCDKGVAKVFAFIEAYNGDNTIDCIGFGCSVNETTALPWIQCVRPDVYAEILQEKETSPDNN